jgi:hypothetical protein
MTKKRTSHETPKPRGVASGIPVFCLHDEIVDAASLKLWSEQPGQKNPQVHPAKQLDRYELVVAGDGRKPGNGFRRCAVVSTLSGCVTKGNGLVMMARRRGWQVPIERQAYANRAEEIRDVAADNRIAEMAEHDDDALKKMLGELDPGEIQFAAVSAEEFEQLLADAGIAGRLRKRGARVVNVDLSPESYARWSESEAKPDAPERRFQYASKPPLCSYAGRK